MRVICMPAATDVIYLGIAVKAGTRDELPEESGMAHLVEHMSFKGTTRLTATQIASRLESVGGELNAFTGKEETMYYAACMRQHVGRAIPLLVDMVFNSTYPQRELEREVEVVADEIESYEDSPSELIFDEFDALLFPNHPLGRSILGKAETLRTYKSEKLKAFTRRLYKPEQSILFVKGGRTGYDVLKGLRGVRFSLIREMPDQGWSEGTIEIDESLNQRLVASLDENPVFVPMTPYKPQTVYSNRATHQAHVLTGNRAYAAQDDRYIGLTLLSNLIGGPGMNSRLNVALRERRGLVYTVESSLTGYTDVGVWGIYFGCDEADIKRCLRLVNSELRRLCDSPLPPRTLEAAKRQLKGQMAISYDHFESVAISMGRQFLHFNQVRSLSEMMQQIDALTALQLQTIAQEILNPDHLTTLVYN